MYNQYFTIYHKIYEINCYKAQKTEKSSCYQINKSLKLDPTLLFNTANYQIGNNFSANRFMLINLNGLTFP